MKTERKEVILMLVREAEKSGEDRYAILDGIKENPWIISLPQEISRPDGHTAIATFDMSLRYFNPEEKVPRKEIKQNKDKTRTVKRYYGVTDNRWMQVYTQKETNEKNCDICRRYKKFFEYKNPNFKKVRGLIQHNWDRHLASGKHWRTIKEASHSLSS
jgi:hypothetical protein